jgi:hypothetical protein
MHFMPNTEDQDSTAERFWPEGYKQVIKDELRPVVGTELDGGQMLAHVYQQRYSDKYSDLSEFASKIADLIVIGADKGADDAFDDIISAFLTEAPLPEIRRYSRYFLPDVFPDGIKSKLRQVVIDEYSQDNVYQHAYKVGYQKTIRSFDEYNNRVAEIVVTGAINGADDMLGAIYWSLLTPRTIPPARRHPRRLKMW